MTAATSPPPTLSGTMMIDRSSFDETEDFDIDDAAIQERSESELRPAAAWMYKGRVRRRLRWRPARKNQRVAKSGMSVSSQISKQSRRSVHSFASTETMTQSNTVRSKQTRRAVPLPRPNYPEHFGNVATIGTEGNMVHAKMTHSPKQEQAPKPHRGRQRSRPRIPLPPRSPPTQIQVPPSLPADPSPQPIPKLDDTEIDRRVDLRIPTTRIELRSAQSSPAVLTDTENEDDTVLKSTASEPEIRFSMMNSMMETVPVLAEPRRRRSSSSSGPIDLDTSVDEDDDDTSQLTTDDNEMGDQSHDDDDDNKSIVDSDDVETEELRKARTGPVDTDSNSFLEVEKNLQAIHEMATEHLIQGELDEALEVFAEILRGQLARYGKNHARVGTARHNVGLVQARRGDYAAAVVSYEEAVRVRKEALPKGHPDVGVSLAQLGVAYLELKEHRKALFNFRESLNIRKQYYGNYHPKVAKILNNIGCALYELNELKVAQVAFEEALVIQRSLLKELSTQDTSESQILGIASTQSNLASIKLIHEKYDEAIVDLEEALLLQQCVLTDDHPLVKRTVESLEWVEKARVIPLSDRSSSLVHQNLASNCLMDMRRENSLESREEANEASPHGANSSFDVPHLASHTGSSVMGLLERRFMDFRTRLDLACGAEAISDA